MRIKKPGDSCEYKARVLAVGHECDLAILTVDHPTFFENIKPVKFGGIPVSRRSSFALPTAVYLLAEIIIKEKQRGKRITFYLKRLCG